MYVCLTFESTSVEPSGECLIMPAPSLLADPSSPRAIYGLSGLYQFVMVVCGLFEIPGALRGDLLRILPGIVRNGNIYPNCRWLIEWKEDSAEGA